MSCLNPPLRSQRSEGGSFRPRKAAEEVDTTLLTGSKGLCEIFSQLLPGNPTRSSSEAGEDSDPRFDGYKSPK